MKGRAVCVFAICLVSGCTVGPDFKTPPPPTVSSFTAEPAKDATGLRWKSGEDIAQDWWTVFRSPQLDALIKEAFEHSPDLKAAQAALRVAMENVKAQQGAFYPSVGLGLGASRNKQSAQLSPVLASPALLYNLYQTQLSVSWTPDIWGANRRTVEALQAQADAQRYQLQSAYVSLASNLVAAAIQEASLRQQVAATQDLIAGQQRILAIERQQRTLGQISGQDVAAQETVVAQTEALLPPLQKQLVQQRNLLTVLVGRYPADQVGQSFQMRDLTLPQELPLSLPSRLVAQRADVRMAEETMHAASAEVGVATANTLPNITLTGNAGAVSTQLSQLFGAGSGFWSVGASLTQPVFDGGTLLHRKRAAEATLEQASFLYRGTVLRAFQDVADTLAAIESDVSAEQSAAVAEKAAAKSLSLAQEQQAVGQTSRLALLAAQVAYLQTRMASITAHTNRLADSAALFQALGGGWWNRPSQPVSREEASQ
ncbi:MAG TPA: efflux transporter outer membrane subunit [Rhizomicrobium sp.]|nr:efflux transporter outer membrane subunit [Rhizomicrobium sp.]